LKRKYQYNFSKTEAGKYDALSRTRKAETMITVLSDFIKKPLSNLSLLNVGGSGGIIDNILADFLHSVTSIDIDINAIQTAQKKFPKKNISFKLGDGLKLDFKENFFDIVICSQVYEHVTSPKQLMDEIYKVLKPGGICYFAASNRFMYNEPHYNLPLLSIVPRPIAHKYIKITGKADYYHELHYSYWSLKKLVKNFQLFDYTEKIILNPIKYKAEYMIEPGSLKHKIASLIAKHMFWSIPGYIWILKKNNPKKG